jgi:hypothetical protein
MSFRPVRGEPAVRWVSARVTETELRALRHFARVNSLPLSSLIAEALAEFAGDLGEAPPLLRCNSCAVCRYRDTTREE